jgi:hypothetical protein
MYRGLRPIAAAPCIKISGPQLSHHGQAANLSRRHRRVAARLRGDAIPPHAGALLDASITFSRFPRPFERRR